MANGIAMMEVAHLFRVDHLDLEINAWYLVLLVILLVMLVKIMMMIYVVKNAQLLIVNLVGQLMIQRSGTQKMHIVDANLVDKL